MSASVRRKQGRVRAYSVRGDVLDRERVRRGILVTELADAAGVHVNSLRAVLRGGPIGLRVLRAVCRSLKLHVGAVVILGEPGAVREAGGSVAAVG